MKFARKLGREAVPEWASKYVAYKSLKQAVEERSERFVFLYCREAEKVSSFYAQHAAFLESRIAAIEATASSSYADPAALVESAEELGLEVRRLTHYCTLNMEGLLKILRKYDRAHGDSNLTAEHYPPRLAADSQYAISDYHKQTSLFRGRLSLLISAQTTRSKHGSTPIEMGMNKDIVDKVWSTIYKVKKHAVFERDDVASLVSHVDNLSIITALSQDFESGSCSLSKREEYLLLKVLVESACRNGAAECLRVMIDAGLAIPAYEALTCKSLIHVTLSKKHSSVAAMFCNDGELIQKNVQPEAYSAIVRILLANGASLDIIDDQKRTVFHIAAIALGNQHAAVLRLLLANCPIDSLTEDKAHSDERGQSISNSGDTTCIRRPICALGDVNGCTPLFYAIEGGCVDKVAAIYERFDTVSVQIDSDLKRACPIKDVFTHDEGRSTDISTSNESSPATSSANSVAWDPNEPDLVIDSMGRALWTPVLLAARMGHADIIRYLAGRGLNLDAARGHGEPPLYVCAKANNEACLTALLECGAHVDARDVFTGMTALCAAASSGCSQCVSILLAHKAGLDTADDDGWTAHEHAAYHGHLQLAKQLEGPKHREYAQKYESQPCPPDIGTWATAASPVSVESEEVSDDARKDQASTKFKYADTNTAADAENVVISERNEGREYGHRFIGDNTMLLATVTSIEVALHHTPLELRLSLAGIQSISRSLQLPMNVPDDIFWEENSLSLDFSQTPESIAGETLLVDLQRMNPFGTLEIYARGAISLSTIIAPSESTKRRSCEIHAVTLLAQPDLVPIGSLKIRILLVTPLSNTALIKSIEKRPAYWKTVASRELVIGHRGIGSDMSALTARRLQIRENTVLSMIVAASLGAEYVEFDVQLTRDNVPVLYHDYIVSETGVPVGVSSLSLDELRTITRDARKRATQAALATAISSTSRSRNQSLYSNSLHDQQSVRFSVHGDLTARSVVSGQSAAHDILQSSSDPRLQLSCETASHSSDSAFNVGCPSRNLNTLDLPPTRPKSTASFSGHDTRSEVKPFVIDSPFCTLVEAFREAPLDLGFNIELKYPMSYEITRESIPHVPDINSYCDHILEAVFQHAGSRNIMFSSFHPDVCVLMSLKQPTFPVFFLTQASGAFDLPDRRMTSLHSAVSFAQNSHLLGIVCDASAVVAAPRIISKVKERGLLIFTYGDANNDVGKVRLQRSHGVDAVIVDAVAHVRKGLLESRTTCTN